MTATPRKSLQKYPTKYDAYNQPVFSEEQKAEIDAGRWDCILLNRMVSLGECYEINMIGCFGNINPEEFGYKTIEEVKAVCLSCPKHQYQFDG